MEGELVGDSPSDDEGEVEKDDALVSFTEQFYKHLPYYMSIGMTPEQYWEGDYDLPIYYRKAYELQKERRNEELWLQGLYVYEAIADISPILQVFAKSGTKAIPYPNEPYAITPKQAKARAEREQKRRMELMKSEMKAWAESFNEKFKSESGGDESGKQC